jgi:hypothetical protein
VQPAHPVSEVRAQAHLLQLSAGVEEGGEVRSRGVVGQRIVKISQSVVSCGQNREPANVVEFMELEDGTKLYPMTIEQDDGYATDFAVHRPKRHKKQHTKERE